ncbi:lipopolysaccharide biosynthesis protein [Kitasatospora sp. McL0602]|uniref:lipopolysaccharide biosynthesis protein n=1 Tax=Kitasatospora sp. McL0602 TaxID=3439530 RepID=UPI003F8A4588
MSRHVRPGLFDGVGWSAIAQAAPLVVNVALMPYLVTRLGVDRFGVWSLILVFLWSFTTLDGGVSASLARFFSVHRARRDRAGTGRLLVGALLVLLTVGVLVTGVCLLLLPAASGSHIPAPLHREAAEVLRLLGPLVTLALLSNSATALLQANARFRGLAGVTLTSCAVYAAAVLLLVGPSGTLPALAAATALRFAVLLVGGLALGARHFTLHRPLLPPKAERREFGGYALRMQLSGFTVFLNGEIDAFVIAAVLPVRYVGVYAAGYQAAAALRSLPLYAFPPLLTRLTTRYEQQGLPGAVGLFHSLQARWLPAVLGYGAVTTVAVLFAVPVWLGPGFALGGAVAATLLAGYSLHVALTGIRTCFVRAVGRPGLETRYSWYATVVNTVLTVPLALLFGVVGVVAATAIGLIAGSWYFVVLCRRLAGLHEQRAPRRWAYATGLAVLVTAAGELPVARSGWHGTAALLLTGLPALAGLALLAAVAVGAPGSESGSEPGAGAAVEEPAPVAAEKLGGA